MVVRAQLYSQVNSALEQQRIAIETSGFRSIGRALPSNSARSGGPAQYVQIVDSSGSILWEQTNPQLPVTRRAELDAASGNPRGTITDTAASGTTLREITFGLPNGALVNGVPFRAAVQLARPLGGVQSILDALRLILLVVWGGGTGLALLAGRAAARRVLAPLEDTAIAVEHIRQTEDLSRRVPVHAHDEVGRLAVNFNGMLERLAASRTALAASVAAQRQLVADASHELRTPITSIRTNLEVLDTNPELQPSEERAMLADMLEQTDELSSLINDLIETARADEAPRLVDDIRLDELVENCVRRARLTFPGLTFQADLEPTVVEGLSDRLRRAINNVIDNAALHSRSDGLVVISLTDGTLTVRDHGDGIAAADLPNLFQRFYRGKSERSRPGTGLGLSIVKQVADQHAADVSARNHPDGGAEFALRFRSVVPIQTGSDEGSPTPARTTPSTGR
ncbi:MAG: HAMP domain-containing sensor histidine kinase [Actinomycetota bacterium]|nr:HAMP domain-containing sensor histidine kinase [Actinomycetota bacterium]